MVGAMGAIVGGKEAGRRQWEGGKWERMKKFWEKLTGNAGRAAMKISGDGVLVPRRRGDQERARRYGG